MRSSTFDAGVFHSWLNARPSDSSHWSIPAVRPCAHTTYIVEPGLNSQRVTRLDLNSRKLKSGFANVYVAPASETVYWFEVPS